MTILIKNIQLIDGTGRAAVKADVLVKNDKISAMGSFPRYRADEVIDGLGAYLSPGFININADSDRYLNIFSHPSQEDFLLQGATTIIGGQCGLSLAPLIYGSLESISDWADVSRINVNWHTVAEFLQTMEHRPIGVNFGTFVGHRTIRQALVAETSRDLSRNELRIFNLILEKSLKQGAFGFSTGLDNAFSRRISYAEIKSLAGITAKFKGLYATHLRHEKKDLLSSVSETIDIAKETGAKILISHFRPLIGAGNDYEEALDLIDKNTDKADVYFDIYPFDVSVVLLSAFLPDWIQDSDQQTMLKNIQTSGFKEKIIKEFPKIKGEKIIVVNAPGHEYLLGKSLKEFSQNRNLTIYEGLLSLMKLTNFRAAVFYENINFNKAIKAMSHNRAIIASNGVSRPKGSYRTFTRFLELAEKEKIMPIETAVYKITGLPAQRLGLKGRGLIRDGFFADLVVFKDAEIREVILNGKRVVKAGKFQNVLAGKILKKHSP